MPSHTGPCPSGMVRRGGRCVRKELVDKVERQPGETKQECVDRAIPKLIGEGMTTAQAVAVANDMCDLRMEKGMWKGIIKWERDDG